MGSQSVPGSRPAAASAALMVGKRSAKESRPVASSQRWSTDCSSMRRVMARDTSSRGRQLVDEALTPGVAQQGTVAPQGLRQQRPRHRRVVQGGGVELHELDVGHRGAGPQGHGHAVARALDRVGRHREQLPGAAGGQQHVVGPDDPAAAVGAEGHHAAPPGPPRPAGPGRRRSRGWRWRCGARRRPGPARSRRRWRHRRRAPPGAGCGRPRGPAPGAPGRRGRTWPPGR